MMAHQGATDEELRNKHMRTAVRVMPCFWDVVPGARGGIRIGRRGKGCPNTAGKGKPKIETTPSRKLNNGGTDRVKAGRRLVRKASCKRLSMLLSLHRKYGTSTDFFDYTDPQSGERFTPTDTGSLFRKEHYADGRVLFHIPLTQTGPPFSGDFFMRSTPM